LQHQAEQHPVKQDNCNSWWKSKTRVGKLFWWATSAVHNGTLGQNKCGVQKIVVVLKNAIMGNMMLHVLRAVFLNLCAMRVVHVCCQYFGI